LNIESRRKDSIMGNGNYTSVKLPTPFCSQSTWVFFLSPYPDLDS
jgi:hypothetical protein